MLLHQSFLRRDRLVTRIGGCFYSGLWLVAVELGRLVVVFETVVDFRVGLVARRRLG